MYVLNHIVPKSILLYIDVEFSLSNSYEDSEEAHTNILFRWVSVCNSTLHKFLYFHE